jgi:hypothetical protein
VSNLPLHHKERQNNMQTLTQEVLTVKRPCPDADLLDKAFSWGHEDATERIDARGSVYFVGVALENYNEGYATGLEVRQKLEGPSDELAFMAGALEAIRKGKTPAECALADAWLEN